MYFPLHQGYFVDDYCVLDLETTGLKANSCEVIEVGILKIRHNQPVSKMDVLIRPKKLPISAFITSLTGITTEMVLNSPSIEEVSYWIWDFIGTDPILGYNVNFDLSFLKVHTTKHTPTNSCLDVLPLAQIAHPEQKSHSLSAMTSLFHLYQNTHRAIDDCIATYQLYSLLKDELAGNDTDTINQAIYDFKARRRQQRHASRR